MIWLGQNFSCRYARWSVNLEVEKISGVVAKTPPPPPTQLQRLTPKTSYSSDANHANQDWVPPPSLRTDILYGWPSLCRRRVKSAVPTVLSNSLLYSHHCERRGGEEASRAEEVNPISLKRRRCNNHLTTGTKYLHYIKVDYVSHISQLSSARTCLHQNRI